MPRSLASYLKDIEDAGEAIQRFTSGKSVDDYIEDDFLQSAVERKFTIIGEALAQIRHHFPSETNRVEHARQIIDFRNLLCIAITRWTTDWSGVLSKGSLCPFNLKSASGAAR